MKAIGARSVTGVALFAGAAVAMWQTGLVRADYWAQLSPWVPFLVGGFAVLLGTMVFRFWRLAERSEYYFRFGELLPWGGETALGSPGGRSLLVGHSPQVEVLDFAPLVQRGIYIATFLCVGMITVNNRAVTLLRDVPQRFDRASADFCAEPAVPRLDETRDQGCKLVLRAYKLGYTKSLGSCAPKEADKKQLAEVCRKRQLDEPYPHYAWRLFETRARALTEGEAGPGTVARFQTQLDHLGAMFHATVDSISMRPRSSHHLFTNLPDPRQTFGDRVGAILDHGGCGSRLAHLPFFPHMEDGPSGPSKLVEHVLAQLLFNPSYKPVVAQCQEIIVHWGAPDNACALLAENPRELLGHQDALESVVEVLAWRRRKVELAQLGMKQQAQEIARAQQIVSFQCLMIDKAVETPSALEHHTSLEGEPFSVREARMKPLTADGDSQIRLYKHLAELLAEGFGYGRLTSNQSVAARPEEAAMATTFHEPTLLLTKLDLLRDADLFLGNEWLIKRPDLLEVYPYHLHLQNFVEVFRRQYKLHRGRL